MIRRAALLILPLLLVGLAACGDDDGAGTTASASGSSSAPASGDCEIADGVDAAKDSEVHTTLAEWTITNEETSADAGVVQFVATNAGAEDHELVIVRGSQDDLPVTDGVVDEEAVDLVGEIEPFAAGAKCIGKFELSAGTYTLFCGIVEEDEGQSHFAEGMVTELEVG